MKYNESVIQNCLKGNHHEKEDLLNSEFHDVLPGTSIKSGEENGIKLLHHGLLDAEKLTTKAFFSLLKAEKPAEEGDYPVFVFNPHPYEYETDVECEFTLADQNWDEGIVSDVTVYDMDGNQLVSQTIKEESNLNLDWRKRVIFSVKLKPFALNRYSIKVEFAEKRERRTENYIYQDETKHVEIDKETGLLKSFCLHGKEYIHDAFLPIMFEDNADPWGMDDKQLARLGVNPKSFQLCKKPSGVFEGLQSVEVIEDGEIYLGIEAFFEKNHSKVAIQYRIYKKRPYIDVDISVFFQDADKLLRVAIPVNQSGEYIGQTAFGTDTLFMDGRENVSHRFVAVKQEDECLAVFNNCIYGSQFENNTIFLSLVRGAGYCVHPIEERPLIPSNRYIKRIDQCEHTYSFRIAVAKTHELERMALEFNQKPFVQNVFPVVSEYVSEFDLDTVVIDNPNITLVTMKRCDDSEGYVLRLFNNSDREMKTNICLGNKVKDLSFQAYEVKTLLYQDGFSESSMLVI